MGERFFSRERTIFFDTHTHTLASTGRLLRANDARIEEIEKRAIGPITADHRDCRELSLGVVNVTVTILKPSIHFLTQRYARARARVHA